MNIPFPAVIKDIHIGTDGILATLDISPPDLSIIAELIDQEVTVTVSAATYFPETAASPTTTLGADVNEKLPFEPDDDFGEFVDSDLPPQPPTTLKHPRRAAKRTK